MKREQTVAEMLINLEIIERAKLEELLYSKKILAWSLNDFRSAEIPGQNGFELKDDSLIYYRPRRLSLRCNQVVESYVN